jgi:enoyl-CoA hydratase/carnithine racemase
MSADIEVKTVDRVQIMRLTRSDKKNALTGEMYDAMTDALKAGETNDGIAAHIFIGSDGVFSAGNDLKDFARPRDAATPDMPRPSHRFISTLPMVTKPMIAAVDGLAVGIGTTMLLHCDLVYVTAGASLRTPFIDLGVIPEAASSLLLPARIGYVRAFEMLCLGEPMSGEQAHSVGIANAVVPAEDLETTAMSAGRRLAAKPSGALAAARRLMRGDTGVVMKRLDEESAIFSERLASAEAQEAFAAFLEKRKPDFEKLRRTG